MKKTLKAKAVRESSTVPVRSQSLQRKCACGNAAGLSGECEECQGKQLAAQRKSGSASTASALPANVEDVLHSPGKPLDGHTLSTMEARLGHDFSNVRVHVDERANASASSLGATAYTVGDDIVFAAGKFDPHSQEGSERLGHELTHVVQQRLKPDQGSVPSGMHEAEAQDVSLSVASGHAARVNAAAASGSIQLDKGDNPLDEKAKAIIAIAKDDKKTAAERAVAIVKAIIDEYYATDKPLIDSVVYNNEKAGTGAHAEQKFSKTSKPEESTGIIYVGDDFLKGVTATHFARRVLQVGHEIEHIHQWREGLAGGHKSSEREFLAFYHEATLPEKPGTGRMTFSTRIRLIDAALGNYYCLDAKLQTSYADKKKELLDRRIKEIAAGGKPDKADPPTECKKSS